VSAEHLADVSTRWSVVREPARFVGRYATAIRRYLVALLRDEDEADEVAQDFLLKVAQGGFVRAAPDRGRFRFYLIASVRNAARAHQARRQARPAPAGPPPEESPADDDAQRDYLAEWRRCLLDAAWRGLEEHERQSPGNLCHTALRLAVDHPEANSAELASKASAQAGQPLSAEAFRKQLSRARRLFAERLVAEVESTLDEPTPAELGEELNDVGLTSYVRPFVPPGRIGLAT
jgi:RNA polymerase sigma-70 factor (ECF subfamily)